MKKFEIISYNYDEQKISLRLNHLVNNGLIIIKDIDLDATLYKMEIGNVGPGWNCFIIPTPKHGMDFNSNDFQILESNVDINENGGTYIYMAFATNPT